MKGAVRMSDPGSRLIVALDYHDPGMARATVLELASLGVGFKIGLELFMAAGPRFTAALARRSRVFLDLKYHDIPNTVRAAVCKAAALGVWMLNVHAGGGREMMQAARRAVEEKKPRPLLLAVTVLTSMDEDSLEETGCPGPALSRVCRLAALAADCGLDGVVCSPLEIKAVKSSCPPGFITVSPGIRPAGAEKQDQKRVAGPGAVLRAGGDYLVVGRPITGSGDPRTATESILAEMRANG